LILSWVLGQGLNHFAQWMAQRRGIPLPEHLFLITPTLAVQALGFAFIIGVVAGLYPAHRAARLDPLAALRHE
jgi:ABC-type antimicrobial peptide transport system permease subunit